MKVAIIGAGSIVFCKTLMLDIMNIPELGHVEFALMAPSTKRTQYVKAFADRVIKANNLDCEAYVTTDRSDALCGADYVICTLQVGGTEAYGYDVEIPLKYGVDQCIGDTLSPGGIFRALRSIPVMIDLADDMKKLCPDALLLNYVNPMAPVCWALSTTGIKYVGLCHGVQTTLDLISGYVDVPKKDIDYVCAGINHMGWFLSLKHKKQDLYPKLRERFEHAEYYANEKVRGEVMRHFGYFMTESTGHLSEYLPYFRKNELGLKLYCDEPDFGGETGAYLKWCRIIGEKYNGVDVLTNESSILPERSVEYGSYIIEAIELNRLFRFNGNLRNNGMITNLPDDCCAEMTVFADGSGLHQTFVGDLPAQCAALNMTNILTQRLTVEAALTGDPEKAMQACALDPLTSAKLTLKEIRDMTTEMFIAEQQWLPQFKGKLPVATPVIDIPKDVVRAAVPVDPALAINARFGQL